MMKKLLLLTLLTTLSACGADDVVTDPEKLREITDKYRSDPGRPNDFIPQGDGTVIDKRTGLQWMRCSLGQEWTGKTCLGKASKYDWFDALKQNPEFAGYGDWRLPNLAELETLVYCRTGRDEGRDDDERLDLCKGESRSPTIARQTFPKAGNVFYWSSISRTDNNDYAWGVYFLYGYSDFTTTSGSNHVRLVRGGQ